MSRGVCVEKLPHSCGSKDGLQVFQQEDGSYDGFCFACCTPIANPYEDKPPDYKPQMYIKSQEEIQRELQEIAELPTLDLVQKRGLRKDILEMFGVKVGVSRVDGVTPETVYFPYYTKGEITGYKVRLLPEKKMWAIGTTKEAELFGWQLASISNAKRLCICEGEFDAIALYQMLVDSVAGTKWESYKPAVVSLPNGVHSCSKVIAKYAPDIRRLFEEVVYVKDDDAPGQKGADDFIQSYPLGRVATLPAKDANDCLLKGLHNEAVNAVKWRAAIPKNTKLILGSKLIAEAKKPPVMGLDWPWPGLTHVTRGRRRGETIYFGAGVKLGLK